MKAQKSYKHTYTSQAKENLAKTVVNSDSLNFMNKTSTLSR